MEVTGKITKILPIETGQKKDGSGEWKKLSFILDNNAQYNNIFCFEIFGAEKVDKFNQYNRVGDVVKVDFNVNTNEWQGKYYTSLQAWKVFKSDEIRDQQAQSERATQAAQQLNQEQTDIPF